MLITVKRTKSYPVPDRDRDRNLRGEIAINVDVLRGAWLFLTLFRLLTLALLIPRVWKNDLLPLWVLPLVPLLQRRLSSVSIVNLNNGPSWTCTLHLLDEVLLALHGIRYYRIAHYQSVLEAQYFTWGARQVWCKRLVASSGIKVEGPILICYTRFKKPMLFGRISKRAVQRDSDVD